MPRTLKKSANKKRIEDRKRKDRERHRLQKVDLTNDNENVIEKTGVCAISDGGLAHPSPSSLKDERPSVYRGVIDLSDGGAAHPSSSSVLTDEGPSVYLKHAIDNTENITENPTCYHMCSENNLNVTDISRDQHEIVNNEPWYTATPLIDQVTSLPVGSDLFILGSFHQADSRFSEESRGSQCTLNALCALIYANYSSFNTSKDLDSILLEGDSLYKQVVYDLQKRHQFKSRLLEFGELPHAVNVFNRHITIQKFPVISGVCTQQFQTMHLPYIYQALDTTFMTHSHILVMIGSVCSAVFMKDNQYFFFDSHSHGSNGFSSESGRSLLVSFHQLQDLVTFMYGMYESMLIDITNQFDLLPVSFSSEICVDIKNRVFYSENQDLSGEWQVVTKKRRPSFSSNKIKNETISSCESSNQDTVTLIGKYFKDQNAKNASKKIQNRNVNIRKEYMKIYKQKQRLSDQQRKRDREYTLQSMKKARESGEIREKDREYTLKSKKNARQSEEFREKDRQYTLKSKKKARESEEFREKDIKYTLKSMKKARESEEFREKDREYTLKSMKNARQSEEFREKDRKYTLKSKKKSKSI